MKLSAKNEYKKSSFSCIALCIYSLVEVWPLFLNFLCHYLSPSFDPGGFITSWPLVTRSEVIKVA